MLIYEFHWPGNSSNLVVFNECRRSFTPKARVIKALEYETSIATVNTISSRYSSHSITLPFAGQVQVNCHNAAPPMGYGYFQYGHQN
jgi:hypothetical protein